MRAVDYVFLLSSLSPALGQVSHTLPQRGFRAFNDISTPPHLSPHCPRLRPPQVATAATDFNAQSSVRPFHYGDHGGDDYDNETAGDYAHVGPANEGAAMGGDGAGEGVDPKAETVLQEFNLNSML